MQDITRIGIDLGKHSFHVHGQDRHGKALLRKKFSRNQLTEFFAKCRVACTYYGVLPLAPRVITAFLPRQSVPQGSRQAKP
jgi:transposase